MSGHPSSRRLHVSIRRLPPKRHLWLTAQVTPKTHIATPAQKQKLPGSRRQTQVLYIQVWTAHLETQPSSGIHVGQSNLRQNTAETYKISAATKNNAEMQTQQELTPIIICHIL